MRFTNGIPQSIFYSEHSGGAAYKFGAVEKIGVRVRASIGSPHHFASANSVSWLV